MELTRDELEIIISVMSYMRGAGFEFRDNVIELHARIELEIAARMELESIDMNDCGDACKL